MKNLFLLGLSCLLASVSALPYGQPPNGFLRRAGVRSVTDSGLKLSDVESEWPDENTMRRVLTTAPNKAVFWTGRNGGVSVEGRALLVAKSFGANTLEGALAKASLTMPGFDFKNQKVIDIWTFASATFAKGATGEVFLVTGRNVREDNFFHKEELPRLKRNRKITKITKIDGLTNRRTVIFERNAKKEDAAINEANVRQKACLAKPPVLTVPRRSNSFRRDLEKPTELELIAKRAAPPAKAARRNTGAAPACPLPNAPQAKKVVARSNTAPKKQTRDRSFAAGGKKPKAKPPVKKTKVARPVNRPRRKKGAAAPPRKRVTPAKKPKKVAKPASKPRGKPRKRR
ncbi:Transposase [Favolaschia claudopus]|uniref:Transposase n=1 Tax=Favolaschia claudopus TaxID=2862362 RepID=A0AAW0CY55_9AGAR